MDDNKSVAKTPLFRAWLNLILRHSEPMQKDNFEKKVRILVVEDDLSVQRLYQQLLSKLNHDVYCANNGKQALQMVSNISPDLILMDADMPEMNGFEATSRIKSNSSTRGIPIIMITGLHDTEHRVKALEAGVDDFLAKPPEKTEIIATIRSQLKVKAFNDTVLDYQRTLEQAVALRTDQLNNAMNQLKDTSLEIIYRLSAASEYRDEDTGAHIQRLSYYSAAIADKMGLGSKTVESIMHAAPMHDIGKIGIPDSILLKPGKLNEAEWNVMKEHTTIGARILRGSNIPLVRMAETIALNHHEKWDGSGYPRGLKGKKIPLVGRIVAVADVFDALTSKRPYKPEFAVDRSLKIITSETGRHFDPDVIKAFMAGKGEILRIKARYAENSESLLLQMMEKV